MTQNTALYIKNTMIVLRYHLKTYMTAQVHTNHMINTRYYNTVVVSRKGVQLGFKIEILVHVSWQNNI